MPCPLRSPIQCRHWRKRYADRDEHPPTLALLAAAWGAGQSLGTALRDWRPSRFLLCGGIETRDAAAFRTRLFVDDRVDQRRLARADRFFHRLAKLGRRRGQQTHATEGLHQFFVARALDEQQG